MSKEKEQKLNEVLWRFIEELIDHTKNYEKVELSTNEKINEIQRENNLPIEEFSIALNRDESGRRSASLFNKKNNHEEKRYRC